MTDMTKQTEAISTERALKLALEALELSSVTVDSFGVQGKTREAITALREALTSVPDWASEAKEQPAPATELREQEPVVWMYVNRSTHETVFQKHMRSFVNHSQWKEAPLYGEPLANHELQCVCGAVWCGDEMVHLPDKRPPAQRKPLTDELNQIEKDLSFHGLTLVKTATGYAVLKLGQITAHAIEAKLREKNGIKEHT